MKEGQTLRKQILAQLDWEHAHVGWGTVVADWPADKRGVKLHGAPHTPWQILEHMRIAQWDILEFSRNARHVSPDFPEGYWPKHASPPKPAAWDEAVAAFGADLSDMKALVDDPLRDLMDPFPHGTGQNLLREALLLADHNAYHLGQLVLLRKLLGAWPRDP